MPFFPRKKTQAQTDKSSKSKRKSQFFDTEEVAIRDAIENTSEKRRSKSKFYDDLPVPQNTDSPDTASIGSTNSHASSTSRTSQPLPKVLAIETQGDLGQAQINDVWCRRTSLLSRSFCDILHDQDLIGQFIQYMTSKDRGHLVKFWLDSENFTKAALSRIRVHSIHSVIDSPLTVQSHVRDEAQPDIVTSHTKYTNSGSTDSTKSDSSGKRSQADNELQESIKVDAVNIYSRYIALDCKSPIGITEELRNSTISKICSEDGRVDPLCFKDCQDFIEDIFEKLYYKEFVESPYYRRYQVQMIVDNRLHLIDVLYNENIMFYFLEYAEQENGSSLLQFWMAVDNFQKQLEADQYTAIEAQSDAMVIYEKYFSLQASEPLGFADKVRMHVELNICREEGPLPDCFLIPKIIILQTIEKTLFIPFLQSQMYYRYLSELIGSNQSTTDNQSGTPKLKSKKSHSRKGSNTSGCDTHSLGGHALPDNDTASISSATDSRLPGLDDELPLWRKTHQRKAMTLGHLNEFGQYVSELEIEKVPDLDKNKGNRFSRKKREKEREQEAMAWEVTKMIISGVQKEVSSKNDSNGMANTIIPAIIEPTDTSQSSYLVTEL